MLLRLASVLMLAAVALTAGCSSDPGPPADIEYHSTPIGSGNGGAGTDDKPKADRTREGGAGRRTVVATDSGFAFRAPRGWSVLSDDSKDFAASSPRMKEIAAQLGMTPEQLQAAVDQVEVFMSGFEGRLTVASQAGSGGLPSQAEMDAGLGSMNATVGAGEDVSTPLGAGRVFPYELAVGGVTQHGAVLCFLTGGRGVALTVVTASASGSRAVVDQVIPTLRRS